MKNEKFKKYTVAIIKILKKRALEAKENRDKNDKTKNNSKDYTQGQIMGYYSIISLLKHQSFVFCIDQKELGLAGIKPDEDLLGLHKNLDIESEEDNWAIDDLNEEKIKRYLSDTVVLLIMQARAAKEAADSLKGNSKNYNKGELMVYGSTLHLLKEQAQIEKIDLAEIALAEIDPEFFMPLKDMS